MLYHLGCGQQRLDGFVNVDVQPTEAADLVADLNTLAELPDERADGFFSHAFFEHLYRDSRAPHLKAVRERLGPDGFACYLGLPDFRRVAEMYLAEGRGVEGPVFDLHNVYRYTHGDPEMGGTAWLPQLHKSLFDVPTLDRLLRDAGFPAYVIFRYVYAGDPPEIDLSLGFYATSAPASPTDLQAAATSFLERFDGSILDLSTLRVVHGTSRSSTAAYIASTPQTLGLRRLVRRVACRLAQHS